MKYRDKSLSEILEFESQLAKMTEDEVEHDDKTVAYRDQSITEILEFENRLAKMVEDAVVVDGAGNIIGNPKPIVRIRELLTRPVEKHVDDPNIKFEEDDLPDYRCCPRCGAELFNGDTERSIPEETPGLCGTCMGELGRSYLFLRGIRQVY